MPRRISSRRTSRSTGSKYNKNEHTQQQKRVIRRLARPDAGEVYVKGFHLPEEKEIVLKIPGKEGKEIENKAVDDLTVLNDLTTFEMDDYTVYAQSKEDAETQLEILQGEIDDHRSTISAVNNNNYVGVAVVGVVAFIALISFVVFLRTLWKEKKANSQSIK